MPRLRLATALSSYTCKWHSRIPPCVVPAGPTFPAVYAGPSPSPFPLPLETVTHPLPRPRPTATILSPTRHCRRLHIRIETAAAATAISPTSPDMAQIRCPTTSLRHAALAEAITSGNACLAFLCLVILSVTFRAAPHPWNLSTCDNKARPLGKSHVKLLRVSRLYREI